MKENNSYERVFVRSGIRKYDACIDRKIWTSPDYDSYYDHMTAGKHYVSTPSINEIMPEILKIKEKSKTLIKH